jgi:hypothetical protein
MTPPTADIDLTFTDHPLRLIPELLSTKSRVCPYVLTVSIKLTAWGYYTLFASFAKFDVAWGTWKFNQSKFLTSLNNEDRN